jgi:MFS family permease
MMIFSAAPFIGPVLGPLVSGFINENTYWRWTYYVIIIWSAVMLVLLIVFVPESYSPELLRRRAERLRKETGDERWIAPVEKSNRTFWEALKKSIKTPFSGCLSFDTCLTLLFPRISTNPVVVLLSTQYMVLFLDLWSALILGILYLFFGGVPYVFRTQHGFTLQQTGLSFLGIGFGQVVAVACQPYFNK